MSDKPTSDTPRTDTAWGEAGGFIERGEMIIPAVPKELACQLERELSREQAKTAATLSIAEDARRELAEVNEHSGQQLAACSCAAILDTPETHEKAKIDRENPFWSLAYEDVMRRTAECIELRSKLAEANRRLEVATKWQPIATAPKNGSTIIVAWKPEDSDCYIVSPAAWDTGYGGDLETAPWDPTFVTLEGADMINPEWWKPLPSTESLREMVVSP